jgi:hypothetical protein
LNSGAPPLKTSQDPFDAKVACILNNMNKETYLANIGTTTVDDAEEAVAYGPQTSTEAAASGTQ